MKSLRLHCCCVFALTIVVAGCATPQAALDQANNGATLMLSLQGELNNFRSAQASVAKARIDSVKKQAVEIARTEVESAFGDRVLAAAGKTATFALINKLKDLADSRIKDDLALTDKLTDINNSLTKLLTSLPDTSEKLTSAQKALAILGENLSISERLELTSKFVQSIKEAIDGNKKKISSASESAPTAAAQTAPTPVASKP